MANHFDILTGEYIKQRDDINCREITKGSVPYFTIGGKYIGRKLIPRGGKPERYIMPNGYCVPYNCLGNEILEDGIKRHRDSLCPCECV